MKRSLVKQFHHLVAGLLMLVHSFQAFEKGQTKTSLLFLGAALVLLVIAGVHLGLERNSKKIGAFFFVFEAILLYYSAWKYKVESDKTMFIVSTLAASYYIGYAVYIFLSKRQRRRKHHRPRSSRSNLDNLN